MAKGCCATPPEGPTNGEYGRIHHVLRGLDAVRNGPACISAIPMTARVCIT